MLIPHKADPNYESEMKRFKADPGSWGAGLDFQNNDTPTARIQRRMAAHFGLSQYAAGRINLIAGRLLADAKNDETKVVIESARADLIERGIL